MKPSHSTHFFRNYAYWLRMDNILQSGLPHERRERHPHKAHQDDEKSNKGASRKKVLCSWGGGSTSTPIEIVS